MSRRRRETTTRRRLAGGPPIPARRNARRPGRAWYLLCEKLESRRLLVLTPLGPLGRAPFTVDGQVPDSAPAEYSFTASPGDLVSLRVAAKSTRSDFAVAVFDANDTEPAQQRLVRFNDNASADTRDAGVDFVVPTGGERYRIVITNVANTNPRFTLTATTQDDQFTLPAADAAFRQPISFVASGMLRLTGDAAIGVGRQLALYNEAGDLVTTSGASGLSGSPRIEQFVLPGRYTVGMTGIATQAMQVRTTIDPAAPPNDNIRVGSLPKAIATADFNGDGRLDIVTGNYDNTVGNPAGTVSVLLGNGDGTFAPQPTFVVGGALRAIATADFDGDGRSDIVTANSSDVSVLLGKGDGTFTSSRTFGVGSDPRGISTADFNGDGRLDIVAANADSGDVSVLLGNGDGTFVAWWTCVVGSSPRGISTADFNGDGRTDIVTANQGSDDVSVFLGSGDGTFAERKSFAAGSFPCGISTADFNGDGRLDIVTANADSDDVSVLLGNGDGTFGDRQTFAVGRRPEAISTADVNGDGLPDVVTLNGLGNDVSILLGNGDGTFAPRRTFAVGSQPVGISTADFNGDGRLDVVTANAGSNDMSILLGNGDGTFASRQTFAVGRRPAAMATADVNGDGRLDVVTANAGSNDMSILLGNGDGTFATQPILPVGISPSAVSIADVNGDGRLDIVTASADNSAVSIRLGNGDGTFAARQTLAVGSSPSDLSIADVNGDGRLDIVTANYIDVSVLLGDGDGTFADEQRVYVGGFLQAISTGDVNGDGRLDIVTANSGDVSVFLGSGDGTFAERKSFAAGSFPCGISTADFNGDGRLDIVTANAGSNDVSIFLGTGDGTFFAQPPFPAGIYPSDLSIADVNGDGRLDIVTANGEGNDVSILLGNGAGTFITRQAGAVVGWAPRAIATVDVNGDSRLDVVTANENNNNVSLLLGNGDGTFAAQRTFAVGYQPRALSTADVNGDGRLDIVTADYGEVSILLGNGAGTFGDRQTFAVGRRPEAMSIADVNGDGRLDIVAANAWGGDVSVLLGNGDGTFADQQTFPVGDSTSAISTADFNGDGRPDIVTAKFYGHDVAVLLGNGDGTFAAPSTFPVGSFPRAIATADMNGDRRLDIVTVNSGDVSILLGGGDGTFAAQQTFAVGRDPTAIWIADVSGDGLPDIVAANGGSNDVSVLLGSGDGTFAAQQTFDVRDLPSAISIGDVNGDGLPDIVTANGSSDDVSVLIGNGRGEFTTDTVLRQGVRMTPVGPTSAGIPAAQNVAIGRLNGNAAPDTLTLDRRGSVFARYDASATAQTLAVPTGSLPAGSLGRAFDARDLAGPQATRVGVIDQSRQMLFTATPNVKGDLVDPLFVRPIGYSSAAVGDEPVAVVAQAVGGPLTGMPLDFNGDELRDVVTANRGSRTVSILRGKGDGTFAPQQSYAVPDAPTAVLVADVDGDWRLDIVTASESGQSISVLRGNKDGTFQAAVRFAVDSPPSSLSAADVDFDDDLDLVFTSAAHDSVTILLGNGDGTFAAGESVAVGRAPRAVSFIDTDGWNGLDIVTANSLDGTVSILLRGADGMFTLGQTLAVGRQPAALDTADINGDGRGDIITADNEDGTVTIWMSDENGGYGFKQTLRVAGNPTSVKVDFFDNDNFPDIATSSVGAVSILRGTEAGTFASQQSFPVTFGPTSAVAVDINRDFRVDLVTVNPASDSVSVMLGYGNGTFASQQPILSRFARTVVLPRPGVAPPADAGLREADRLADLNGDGFADLVVSNINAGSIDIFPSGPDGEFLKNRGGQGSFYGSEWQRLSAGTGPSTVLLADINGDRAADLVSANQVSGDVSVRLGVPGIVGTFLFTAATGFGPEFRYRTSARVYGYGIDPFSGRGSAIVPQKLSDIALGDVNGDGLVDLVATSSQDRSFTILSGSRGDDGRWAGFGGPERHSVRAPITPGPLIATEPAEVRDVVVADFDRDGRGDIALLDLVKERILIYPGSDRAGAFATTVQAISLRGVVPKSLQVADITGPAGRPDGIVDLVVGNDFGDVLTLQGVGDGTFKPYVRADRSVALLATDMDGDGQDDFIYGNKGLDRIQMDRTATRQSFAADRSQGVLGPSAVATVTETIGGEQYKNLVVANGGANQILLFRRDVTAAGSSGEMFLPEPQTFYVGTNPSAVFVGDVNRDGIPDVVVANEGSNDVSVMLGMSDAEGRWTMKAGPRLSSGGSSPAGITVGDFAGSDGIPDIAVTNRGSNSAAILRGIAGGFFNDTSPTFLPLSITAPGPILPVPRPGAPPLIAVGSPFGNQFQTFVPSGAGYASSRIYSGGGATLASTTFGGSTYLAAGSSAGGVSIFLSGPSTLGFLATGKASLPGLTGLAFDSTGRLFGMSPAQDSAINLFSFDSTNGGPANSTANSPLLTAAQAFVTRLVFTPLTTAGVGLVAALVTSEGVALADREEDRPLENAADGDSAAGGGDAENAPVDDAAREPDAVAEEEVESNPLLDFVLGVDGLLATWNKRLASLLLQRTDDAGMAGREQGERDADAADRAAGRAAGRPPGAVTPAAGPEDTSAEDAREPDAPRSARESAAAGPAAVAAGDSFATREHAAAGPLHGWYGQPTVAPIRTPEATSERRSAGLVGLLRAIFAFLQAG